MQTSARYNRIPRLGDASTAVGAGGAIASATISTPAVAAALGLSVGTSALIAGPIIGGIVIALMIWLNRKGPHQKVATTQIVNEAEPILAQNRDAFLNGPKTAQDKEFAIAVFNKIWGEVVSSCGRTEFGNPGQNCISDRQRGGRWDWAGYYLDPIVNTPEQTSMLGINSLGVNLPDLSSITSNTTLMMALGAGLIVFGLMPDSTKDK